jgi:DNA polymerase III delta prime subunit
MEQLWVDKYKPKNSDELLGNNKIIDTIRIWLNKIKKKKDVCNFIFITGPSGVGKTLIPKIILDEYGFDVHEYNSSNHEKIADFKETIKFLSKNLNVAQLMSQKKQRAGVIIDEVCNNYKNKVFELLSDMKKKNKSKNSKKCTIPIIIIIEPSLIKKFKPLYKNTHLLEFKKPTKKYLIELSEKIIKNEKLNFDTKLYDSLFEFVENDIRKLIITFEELKFYSEINLKSFEIYKQNTIKKRKNNTLFEIVDDLLYNKCSSEDCYNNFEYDKYLIPMMMYENYDKYIFNNNNLSNKEKIDASLKIQRAYCDGDLFEKKIYKNQVWELDVYHCFSTVNNTNAIIHLSKNYNKKCEINFTSILSKLSSKKFNYNFLSNIQKDIKISYYNIYLIRNYILHEVFNFTEFAKKYINDNKIQFETIEYLTKIIKDNKDIYRKSLTPKNSKSLTNYYYTN